MEVSKDIIYTKLWGNYVPVPQHEDQNGNMGVTGDNNPLPTKEVQSDVMKPVDIQARLQKTVALHSGTVVAPNTWNYSSGYIDLDGFDKVGLTCTKGLYSGQIDILWSNDNANTHYDEAITTTSGLYAGGEIPIKARYAKIGFKNNDASNPQTVSTWLYPKA